MKVLSSNSAYNDKIFWAACLVLVVLVFAFGGTQAGILSMFAFGLVTTQRSTNEAISETVLVRDVPDEVMVLDGDITPLTVMSVNAKRKRPTFSPRIEKLEDNLRTLWGYMNAAAIASNVTSVIVNDGSLFAPGDLVCVPHNPVQAGADEVFRVTAGGGATANVTLTVVRGIGGTGADTIVASGSLRILGSAYAENGAYGTPRSTLKTTIISYTQIIREPFQLSETQRASKTYGGPEEDFQERMALLNWKKQSEAMALWGKQSETLAAPGTVRTTMGFKPRVQTNVTNVNTTLTLILFNTFGQTAFRYNMGRPRLFIAAPIYISAVNYFSQNKLLTEVGQTVFGVKVKTLYLPHGTLMLANNFLMEAGVAGQSGFATEAYAVDLANVEYRYLSANGVNRDVKLYRNVKVDGTDGQSHEYKGEIGWIFTQEQSHSRMYNSAAYA
jgi:hypothetical protein